LEIVAGAGSNTGGAGSDSTKQNPAVLKGILGIRTNWECRLEYAGVLQATPLTH